VLITAIARTTAAGFLKALALRHFFIMSYDLPVFRVVAGRAAMRAALKEPAPR
jgi:hypothetical protein